MQFMLLCISCTVTPSSYHCHDWRTEERRRQNNPSGYELPGTANENQSPTRDSSNCPSPPLHRHQSRDPPPARFVGGEQSRACEENEDQEADEGDDKVASEDGNHTGHADGSDANDIES